jgi:hypothetical protein
MKVLQLEDEAWVLSLMVEISPFQIGSGVFRLMIPLQTRVEEWRALIGVGTTSPLGPVLPRQQLLHSASLSLVPSGLCHLIFRSFHFR